MTKWPMPHWRKEMKNTIAAVEFEGAEPTIRFTDIHVEELLDPDTRKTKMKLTAHFQGSRRGWVLNATNCELMEHLFGTGDYAKWIGHEVTLTAAMVQLGKEMVPGIRVKGSPELKEPMVVHLKQGKKRITVRLVPTGKGAPAQEPYREAPESKLMEMADAHADVVPDREEEPE